MSLNIDPIMPCLSGIQIFIWWNGGTSWYIAKKTPKNEHFLTKTAQKWPWVAQIHTVWEWILNYNALGVSKWLGYTYFFLNSGTTSRIITSYPWK